MAQSRDYLTDLESESLVVIIKEIWQLHTPNASKHCVTCSNEATASMGCYVSIRWPCVTITTIYNVLGDIFA